MPQNYPEMVIKNGQVTLVYPETANQPVNGDDLAKALDKLLDDLSVENPDIVNGLEYSTSPNPIDKRFFQFSGYPGNYALSIDGSPRAYIQYVTVPGTYKVELIPVFPNKAPAGANLTRDVVVPDYGTWTEKTDYTITRVSTSEILVTSNQPMSVANGSQWGKIDFSIQTDPTDFFNVTVSIEGGSLFEPSALGGTTHNNNIPFVHRIVQKPTTLNPESGSMFTIAEVLDSGQAGNTNGMNFTVSNPTTFQSFRFKNSGGNPLTFTSFKWYV